MNKCKNNCKCKNQVTINKVILPPKENNNYAYIAIPLFIIVVFLIVYFGSKAVDSNKSPKQNITTITNIVTITNTVDKTNYVTITNKVPKTNSYYFDSELRLIDENGHDVSDCFRLQTLENMEKYTEDGFTNIPYIPEVKKTHWYDYKPQPVKPVKKGYPVLIKK